MSLEELDPLEVKIIPVETKHIDFLYQLIKENINYTLIYTKNILTLKQHKKYVNSYLHDYKTNEVKKWYVIYALNYKYEEQIGVPYIPVGSVVLKKSGEFGYQLLLDFQDKGIMRGAVKQFFKEHRKGLWCMINPINKRSITLVEKNGLQLTALKYEVKG